MTDMQTSPKHRGTLRIYLGAAPGVGKTFAMLNEGWRGTQRDKDVVIGYVETHGRLNTEEQIRDLEVIPRRKMTYRDASFEEMDVDAVIARKPGLALIDEVAHTNVPGSRNEKRWQDIDEILDAGINVLSTLNIQHLESINDVVEEITGVKQQETVPDSWVRKADQIEFVDQTPEALRRRMAHGNIYAPEKIDAALTNYFRPGNLGALREIALLWVADRVEEALTRYRDEKGITEPWETRERVLVGIKGTEHDDNLIRRGARMASRARGELLCVYVRTEEGLASDASSKTQHARDLALELGGVFHEVVGSDVAEALIRFAKAQQATQLVIGSSRRGRLAELWGGSVINKVVRLSGPLDVHVISFSNQTAQRRQRSARRRLPRSTLPFRRRLAGWLIGVVGFALLTRGLAALREAVALPSVMLMYLILVLGVAVIGGTLPGLVAAVAASLLTNWFFTPPLHTFIIGDPEHVLALVVFIVVAGTVSTLVSVAARRATEAARARAQAEVLVRVAGTLAGSRDPVTDLLVFLLSTFDLESAAILRRASSGWRVEAHSGSPCPIKPEEGDLVIELPNHSVLVVVGPTLKAEDRWVLGAFAAQLSAGLQERRLRSEASEAERLAASNELRTALLASVSHDLRSPLSSIKASSSSLLQADITWSDDETHEFLLTIDEESDRLNQLVGNLLDMSRLQTGKLNLVVSDVGIEEIVAASLAGLGERGRAVTADVPETLPRVRADPGLLERAISSLVDNALKHGTGSGRVRVEAGAIGKHVLVRVVDQGPGIQPSDRDQAFVPFQRLGDAQDGTGVGLGMAIARGFVEAMGGQLTLEDTPGGGLTVIVELEARQR